MSDLLVRPDLDQLRRQARELLRAAKSGDAEAFAHIGAVSSRLLLASAQLAVAREYGFPSWRRLKIEVERREILNSRAGSRGSANQARIVKRGTIAGCKREGGVS
jgi:hypothetical protein